MNRGLPSVLLYGGLSGAFPFPGVVVNEASLVLAQQAFAPRLPPMLEPTAGTNITIVKGLGFFTIEAASGSGSDPDDENVILANRVFRPGDHSLLRSLEFISRTDPSEASRVLAPSAFGARLDALISSLAFRQAVEPSEPSRVMAADAFASFGGIERLLYSLAFGEAAKGRLRGMTFTSNGATTTYTTPSWAKRLLVIAIGAGGGGEGAQGSALFPMDAGSGGGGGGGFILFMDGPLAASYTIQTGVGGVGGNVGGAVPPTPGTDTIWDNGGPDQALANGGQQGAPTGGGGGFADIAGGAHGQFFYAGSRPIFGVSGGVGGSAFRVGGVFAMTHPGGGGAFGTPNGYRGKMENPGDSPINAIGSGGGGACTQTNVNQGGGAGAPGALIVLEFE